MENPTLEDYVELRRLNDTLYDIQEARKRVQNRMRNMPSMDIYEDLQPIEDKITKLIEQKLKLIPIWTEYLSKVKGIGPRLASYVIGKTLVKFIPVSEEDLKNYSPFQQELAQKTKDDKYKIPTRRGIEAFDTISKYWAFWGLGVKDGAAQRRKKGEKSNYNPMNLSTSWKIGKQFVMQGVRYRADYDRYKTRLTAQRTPPEKCPQYGVNRWCKARIEQGKKPTCKAHIHNMAQRYAVKHFYQDLWLAWRTLEGLPVSEPYVIAVLGHEKRNRPEAP